MSVIAGFLAIRNCEVSASRELALAGPVMELNLFQLVRKSRFADEVVALSGAAERQIFSQVTFGRTSTKFKPIERE